VCARAGGGAAVRTAAAAGAGACRGAAVRTAAAAEVG